jgi:hypothetical protein
MLPYWGMSTGPIVVSDEVNYFHPSVHIRAYVGARAVDWETAQRIAGLDHTDEHGAYGSPEYSDYVLSVLPPRWTPNLDHFEAEQARIQAGGGERGIPPVYLDLPEEWDHLEAGPSDYRGCCPDVYDPQMLLFAATRITSKIVPSTRLKYRHERKRYRALRPFGPLLDVRLIKRVRIMQKRGKRWV